MPCRPTDRTHSNGPDLVTRNWVLPLVAPSRVTKTGSVRDASQFSDKKLGFDIGNAIEQGFDSDSLTILVKELNDEPEGFSDQNLEHLC